MENAQEAKAQHVCRSTPSDKATPVLEEIDLTTSISVLSPCLAEGQCTSPKSAAHPSSSGNKFTANHPKYLALSSKLHCHSERNSTERSTRDCQAGVRQTSLEPVSTFASKFQIGDQNYNRKKMVLEPRKRDKHRFFDVPLSDHSSSDDESTPMTSLSKGGKHLAASNGLPIAPIAAAKALATAQDAMSNSSNDEQNAEPSHLSSKPTSSSSPVPRSESVANNGNGGSMLSMSLVREITDEIDSLKRTLQTETSSFAVPTADSVSTCDIPSIPPPPSSTILANAAQEAAETETLEKAEGVDESHSAPSLTAGSNVAQNDYDSDEEEQGLMQKQYKRADQNRLDIPELHETRQVQDEKRKKKIREVYVRHPENPEALLEGALFRARYLGSTQLISDTHTTKYTRMLQAQTALQQVKAPEGETQPSVEVELFVSSEKLLILNTNLKEILMDHALRTVSFIADIGDVVVIMARRRLITHADDDHTRAGDDDTDGDGENADSESRQLGSPDSADDILPGRNGSASALSRSLSGDSTSSHSSASEAGTSIQPQSIVGVPKMQARVVCHVIECDDAQLVAQSIGQAFQVAYVEFLKANGIEEPPTTNDFDYQEVLNSQEMFNEELRFFTSAEHQKDVLIPKAKGEPLGVVVVESGWGSVIPTVVLANMHPRGAAARCGQLNIGDQIISINGISFVGLPLAICQNHIKNVRAQTSVKLTVIGCPPVVEVLVRRPDAKYQLGFSVQNGVICSLLRGGIAERGGVRVGHRIIEINGQSVVAVAHEKIVQMLSAAVGEIHMRTMPTTIFRLLTGQETPHYI